MTAAQGTRTQLTQIAEVTAGTTPATPEMIEVPFVTHSLRLDKDQVEEQTLYADRLPRNDRHGNRRTLGDISVEMRADDYDFLLESMLFNQFATGVLNNGVTQRFFTLEDGATDISEYRVHRGVSVSQARFSIQPNSNINATFTLIGLTTAANASTPLDATPTAASGSEPFDSFSGTLSDSVGGLASVTSFDITINNGVAPVFVVGSPTAPCLEYGKSIASGTLTFLYQDETFINRFVNEEETSLSIVMAGPSGGTSYTLFLPRVKINGAATEVSGPATRLIQAPFVALRDSTAATQVRITKA